MLSSITAPPGVHFPSITFRTLHFLSFVPSSHLLKKKRGGAQNKTVSLGSLMLTLLALVFCLGVYSGSYSWIYSSLSFINFGKILSISLLPAHLYFSWTSLHLLGPLMFNAALGCFCFSESLHFFSLGNFYCPQSSSLLTLLLSSAQAANEPVGFFISDIIVYLFLFYLFLFCFLLFVPSLSIWHVF